jgi:hypothetical protein
LDATQRSTADALAQRAGTLIQPTVPCMLGSTDGRMLRQSGIPTYGFQKLFYDARHQARSSGV